MSKRELFLYVFAVVLTGLGVLWSLAINDPEEVRLCVLMGVVSLLVIRGFGFLGWFDKNPTDEEAGIRKDGQGR